MTTTVDLDGDAIDEFIVASSGYEDASTDLYRFSATGTETLDLFDHAE